MKARLIVALFPLLALVTFAACGKKKPPQTPEPAVAEVVVDAGPPEDAAPPPPKPLFERLGGNDGIKAVIDKFVENVTQDPAVNKSFKATKGPKLDAFKKNLADQVCEVTGGPCKYAGKDMKSAHKGMKITDAQFDALVMDLKLAMGEAKVGDAEQAELIEKLAPLKEDIVESKKKK
jgi:hemoglobin